MKLIKLILLFIFLVNTSNAEEVIKIKPRDGINQRFILLEPKSEIKGIVILFAGGNGKLLLSKDKNKWKTNNFLVRTRELFAKKGYLVAVIDSPSKRKNGMKDGFRTSDDHITDVNAVITYLKKKYPNQKTWLIGTSRGTESVVHLAINLHDEIDGIILTSSVTNSKKYKGGTTILDMNLDEVNVPTLIVSHKKDSCIVTPPTDSPKIMNMLNDKIVKKLVYVDGGYEESSNSCKAKTYHGFLGIENEVIDIILDFIDKN